jgi:DNA modification methylase
LVKGIIDQLTRGRTVAEIAESENVTTGLIEALTLRDLDDAARFDKLGIKIQPYDVWHFNDCDDRFGDKYPGRIPGQLILHVLYFFTKPGDFVIDPMVGSGSTLDACAYMGRKVYGYDAHPDERRSDIIEHDLAVDGWPERTAKAKMIFWDPPYFKKMDAEYGDKSVSALSKDDYLAFFEQAFSSLPAGFKGKIAFLCSDYNDENDASQDIPYWDYVNLAMVAGFRAVRRIQVPLGTQQVHPDIVNRFREERRLARLNRDLVVFVR